MKNAVYTNAKLAEHMSASQPLRAEGGAVTGEQAGVTRDLPAKSPSSSSPGSKPNQLTEKPDRSRGENLFDWGTYGAWNHVANLVLSAVATYGARSKIPAKSNFGKNLRNKTGDTTYKDVMVNWSKEKLGFGDGAGILVDTTMLSVGGNITALGVKPLEDRKEKIVRYFNEKYSPDEVDKPIVDQRKQTWFSVITGRVAVIFGVMTAMGTLDKLLGESKTPDPKKPGKMLRSFEAFENKFSETFFAKPFNIQPNFKNPSRLLKMGKVVSLELIAVTMGSAIFWVTSKMLAKKPEDQKESSKAELPSKTTDLQADARTDKAESVVPDKENTSQPMAPKAEIMLAQHQHEAPDQLRSQSRAGA